MLAAGIQAVEESFLPQRKGQGRGGKRARGAQDALYVCRRRVPCEVCLIAPSTGAYSRVIQLRSGPGWAALACFLNQSSRAVMRDVRCAMVMHKVTSRTVGRDASISVPSRGERLLHPNQSASSCG